MWYRMHYTHASTYEEALDKLLPRLSQHGSIPMGVKWLLLWKDRRGKAVNVNNVTKAVEYRWKMIMKKRHPTKCEWCFRMVKGCKIVQILKWKDEISRGLRNMCPECREPLRRAKEIRVTKMADRKRSADEICKELQKTGSLPLLTRSIRYDNEGNLIGDTITNHIDGTVRKTNSKKSELK
jgi:hypothetical protein